MPVLDWDVSEVIRELAPLQSGGGLVTIRNYAANTIDETTGRSIPGALTEQQLQFGMFLPIASLARNPRAEDSYLGQFEPDDMLFFVPDPPEDVDGQAVTLETADEGHVGTQVLFGSRIYRLVTETLGPEGIGGYRYYIARRDKEP